MKKIWYLVFIVSSILIIIFIYNISNYYYSYKKEIELKNKISKYKFNELLEINPDIVGFIEVDNTEVSYPIVKSNDNSYYLNHTYTKEKSEIGSIFLDYRNNLDSTLTLLEAMKEANCHNFVFSSSATVYGTPKELPIKEDFPLSTTNPYGTTKLMIERILQDVSYADKDLSIIVLRYFNPIGAHKTGLLGEKPNGIPNNLMPYIVRVADKELPILSVFGDDYDTPDGTGVRDYIHVIDLAKGHLKALEKVVNFKGIDYYNLGTGNGYSVLDLVKTFEKVNNVKVPYKIVERRPGDIAACYADPTKAYEELGFKAEYGIEDMCKDSYNFILKNKESQK